MGDNTYSKPKEDSSVSVGKSIDVIMKTVDDELNEHDDEVSKVQIISGITTGMVKRLSEILNSLNASKSES
jgi:hypothetical protein